MILRAKSGKHVHELPPVVTTDMKKPRAERRDWRQRAVEPFELSFFRAQAKALSSTTGTEQWWDWLRRDGHAHALRDGIAGLLSAAPPASRASCCALLAAWLGPGDFDLLRDELKSFDAPITELQIRQPVASARHPVPPPATSAERSAHPPSRPPASRRLLYPSPAPAALSLPLARTPPTAHLPYRPPRRNGNSRPCHCGHGDDPTDN
jgi:hypothetical protein